MLLKMLNNKYKERILEVSLQKEQTSYQGMMIRLFISGTENKMMIK